ncbi:MAG: cyclodeaminase/cyclohydrolase family protein [Phycisphaerae bacterium]|jgi:formiminotetrahydrofolate cyclodeaminase
MPELPLAELSVKEYLARLGSAEPTPGGGSAAALVGALAASLGRMVCALTQGRPKFAAVEEQVRQLASRFTRAAAMLQHLIDEDAAAYAELSAAFKLPRDDAARGERVSAAAGLAAAVPLETMTISQQVWHDLRRLESVGNPALKPDVLAGQHLALAAARAAEANVRANLPFLESGERERLEQQLTHRVEDP